MSNYPDGMTSRDWSHIDGIEHHEECPQHEDFQDLVICKDCIHDKCECECVFNMDCECDTLYPSKYDIELEKLGL